MKNDMKKVTVGKSSCEIKFESLPTACGRHKHQLQEGLIGLDTKFAEGHTVLSS